MAEIMLRAVAVSRKLGQYRRLFSPLPHCETSMGTMLMEKGKSKKTMMPGKFAMLFITLVYRSCKHFVMHCANRYTGS